MALYIVLAILAVLVGLNIILLIVSVLQKGPAEKDSRSMQEILGKAPEQAGSEDLKKLSKADLMQLFYKAASPDFAELKGEYRAGILPVGAMAFSTDLFIHNFFGSGRWIGKGFNPADGEKGWGYNLFSAKEKSGSEKINRTRKMETSVVPSRFTDGEAFFLNYSVYNKGNIGTMRDEIRKINDQLFLGLGCVLIGGGSINPSPFYLEGPPSELQI